MKYKVINEQSLLEALALLAPDCSKTTLRSFLKDERINVDGQIQKLGSFQVVPNQIISLLEKPKLTSSGALRVIYEDSHLIAIEKPSGMLSVSTAFEKGDTAHAFLKKSFPSKKVYVVHRLDQDTSGVMIFALSEPSYLTLKKMFEKHLLTRAYTAIIQGKLPDIKGTWQSYLIEDDRYVVYETNDKTIGKLAITHYDTIKTSKNYSALCLTLETGRKNQIRVHCQNANHPIIGDKKYGSSVNPIKRLGLHAHLLAFEHPMTNKKMHFESPLPKEFKKLDLYKE